MTWLRSASVLLSAWLGLGCGKLLDADRYQVTSVANPCAAFEVPTAAGCKPVGVADCGSAFENDDHAGCEPLQPEPRGPCGSGLYAPPGNQECTVIGLLSCNASERFPNVGTALGESRYVDPEAAPGGTGTKNSPLRSMSEALATLEGAGTLVLSSGVHRGGLDLSSRPEAVYVIGACPLGTTVEGEPGQPVFRLGPGASGSRIEQLAISGGRAGIEAVGTEDLTVAGVWIHDVAGPGVALQRWLSSADGTLLERAPDDAESSAQLENVLIEDVQEAGIVVGGTTLVVETSVIQDVRPGRDGARAIGVSVGADAQYFDEDPGVRRPAQVSLNRLSIANTVGAGVLVQESTLDVSESWIHDVASDGLGLSRGIDARGSASQTLPTRVQVTGSVVEGTNEVGIASFGAEVALENDTIRRIGDTQAAGCRGAGVSIAFPFGPIATPNATLVMTSASIREVGRVAVEIMGGHAELSRLALQGSPDGECPAATGIQSSRSAVSAAPELALSEVRSDDFARGVLASRSQVRLQDSLLSCNESALVGAAGARFEGISACGCADDWRKCRAEVANFERPCEASADGATTCLRVCVGKLTSWTEPVPGATIWALDLPELGSVLADKRGCAELTGVPRGRQFMVAASAPDFAPGLAMVDGFDEVAELPGRATLIPLETTPVFNAATQGEVDPVTGQTIIPPTDTRATPLVGLRVCSSPRRLPDPSRGEPGEGLCEPQPGLTLELEPGPSRPIYFGVNAFPDAELTQTVTSDVAFAAVPAGPQRVVVNAPEGQRLSCKTNRWGWPTSRPNEFVIFAEPGFTQVGAELVCELSRQ